MSVFPAELPGRVLLPLTGLLAVLTGSAANWEIPDLDTIRRWFRRIQELIVLGGVGLSLGLSFVFIGTWVLSHLRQPTPDPVDSGEDSGDSAEGERAPVSVRSPWMSHVALWASFIPVALTLVAAAGMFVPVLRPLMLKMFAYAVGISGVSWLVSVVALIVGGSRAALARTRRALLLGGTPFYCLAIWLARFLTLGF